MTVIDFNDESRVGQQIDVVSEDYDYESDSDIDDFEAEDQVSPGRRYSLTDHDDYHEDSEDDDDSYRDTHNLPLFVKSSEKPGKLQLVGSQYKYRVVIPNIAATTYVVKRPLALRLSTYLTYVSL